MNFATKMGKTLDKSACAEYTPKRENRISLDAESIDAIESIIAERKAAEIAYRNGRLVVFEVRSRKRYERVLHDGSI